MWSILKTFFEFAWEILKLPVVFFGFLTVSFVLVCFIQVFILCRKDGRMLPSVSEEYYVKQKRKGFLWCWFIGAPRQYARDMLEREPGYFKHQGCVIFEGRQGAGKTIAGIEFVRYMQREFPKCKVLTNCFYKNQDYPLEDWKPLVDFKNGHLGVVAFIDEMQNWFSSNQSKDFPPEMLQVITQNRKNRRIILGTAQCFNRLAKPIREQATEVRSCLTLFGTLTIVVCREPVLDSEGDVKKMKYRGMYCFAHDPELREAYDTYRVIESLSKSGFQKQNESPTVNIHQIIKKK